jgi:ATP-dependent Lon protease
MIVPLFVGRERSVQALENVMAGPDKHVVLVTQKDASLDDPKAPDLFTIGTLGTILQLLKLPDGTVKVLVEGTQRVKVAKYIAENDFFRAEVDILHDTIKDVDRTDALARTVTSEFEGYIKLNRKIPPDVLVTINQIDDPTKLADTIASYFSLKISDKQDLLETINVEKRFEKVLAYIESESHVLQTEKRIRSRVKKQMEKTQRDYYLNEQLKAIYKELGDAEDGRDEISDLEERAKKLKLSKEAQERFKSEIKKLKMMNHSSAEATVVRNYLDWILSLPWNARTKVKKDLDAAEVVLDRDHYGLSKIKERILEYLSVQARVGKMRGQILCLVGPPGVGKTSLGKSIAEATGRNFVRISLGGVRDESEVRGHRRTYIGSMPGKILQGMKKAKSANPLFLLDEIDKLGSDWRGDPASALLEVLDPEQNGTFNDHYLELDYDLSDVMFVTTANTLNMPQPLLDRMEIIRIPGYTEDEKMHIAKEYLIPKQFKIHALKPNELKIDDEALRHLIRRYTREAGVRNLEREIANLSRKAVKSIQKDKKASCHVTVENINDFSGVEKYFYGQAEKDDLIGVTTGMAWTESGGDLLMIEAVVLPGKGKTMITGKLGDVMQESVQAALSYVRMRSHIFGIHPSVFEKKDRY